MKKKIGIFGGTFDPPHIGHLIIANEVMDSLKLDEIRFMPNNLPPHKQKSETISNEDRLRMLELAINDRKDFSVETAELKRNGTSYTYDTMNELTAREADKEFYFIIGADMIEYLPKWHMIEELLGIVRFIGVKRPGYTINTEYPVTMVDIPEMLISSTLIRERVSSGKTVKYLLPDTLIRYIKENGLYES